MTDPAAAGPGDGVPDRFARFLEEWNHANDQTTPDIHAEMAGWLDSTLQDGRRDLLLLAFRDSGKSTLVGLYCVWRLARDPGTRILVMAAEQGLAKRMVRTVKRVIETTPPLQALKPAKAELWGAEEFTITRPRVLRDPSMAAKGIGANVTGCHADLIVCDDVEVPNTSATPAKREDLRQRLAELGHVLSPTGTLLYIGTPHCYHTIYAAAPRSDYGETREFLAGFARLELPIEKPDGGVWWPERFTPERLARIRARTGEAKWQSQMLLLPRRDSDGRLDPNRLRRYEDEIVLVQANGQTQFRLGGRVMLQARIWWDPAQGTDRRKAKGGDGSVLALLFTDSSGEAWLHRLVWLDVTGSDEPAREQLRQVAEFWHRFPVPRLFVETNGIGQFLPGLLRGAFAAGTGPAIIPQPASKTKSLRILEAWEPRLNAGHLHAHASIFASPLIQEMEEWRADRDGRDDGLDAVASALLAGSLPPARGRTPTLAQVDFTPLA